HAFRAIRARQSAGESVAHLLRVSTAKDLTYRDLGALLDQLPPTGTERHVPIPDGADAGLLAAVTTLLRQDIASHATRHVGVTGATRTYVYGSSVYQLRLTSSNAVRELKVDTRRYADPIETAFEIRNLTTKETTDFEIIVGTSGDVEGVPLRIRYRPRWWLQVELTLTE